MSDAPTRPPIDAATLERLRRGIPLRMDARGNFTLGEEPVTHPRVIEVFRRGLDITPAGEHQLHVGNQWCYLTIEDCPLRVTAVLPAEDAGPDPERSPLTLRLDDGRALPLELSTLWEEPERGLRCLVPAIRSGRPLAARFTNNAQMDLARWIVWDEPDGEPDGEPDDIEDRPRLDLRELGRAQALVIPSRPPR